MTFLLGDAFAAYSKLMENEWRWLKTEASKGLLENNKRIFRNSENLVVLRVQIRTNQPEDAQTQHVTRVTDV